MPANDFEHLVLQHYEPLYRFAFSLTRSEADACDLTQQTFYLWATKGHQLRDQSKVKSWLFTILHREFLNIRKRAVRFPHFELNDQNADLPTISPNVVNTVDSARVFQFLGQVQEPYQAALSLFYLENYSYKKIAEILAIPIGTVRSRISRGVAQLQRLVLLGSDPTSPRSTLDANSAELPSGRKIQTSSPRELDADDRADSDSDSDRRLGWVSSTDQTLDP
jgi:RNA polymerase sigma-70 factor (ECF subfamily)